MGTNYYWESDPCGTCGHVAEQRHICKSHVTFYSGVVDDDDPPWEQRIVRDSWQAWRTWLEQAGGRIVDEYGTVVPLAEFIASVERSDPEHRRYQHDWLATHPDAYGIVVDYPPDPVLARHPRGGTIRRYWLDPDGFSFTDSEFS